MNKTEPTTFDTTIQRKPDSNIKIIDTYHGSTLALSENGDLWRITNSPAKIMENVKTASFNRSSQVKAITKERELWGMAPIMLINYWMELTPQLTNRKK